MPEHHHGWDDVSGPATDADIQRLSRAVRERMADAEVGPLILRIEAEQKRAASLEVRLGGLRRLVEAWADELEAGAEFVAAARKALGGES